jgi:hypothetical protein
VYTSGDCRLDKPNELHVTSHLHVGGRKHTYTIVYRRKQQWARDTATSGTLEPSQPPTDL